MDAALEMIDESGINSITLKELGQRIGASHTAIYRYFDGIPNLLVSVRARLLDKMDHTPLTGANPRARIIEIAERFREVMKLHPNAAPLFLLAAGDDEAIATSSIAVINELENLGFHGEMLTVSFQALEAYVLGGTVWDLAGSPEHYTSRLTRMRFLRHEAFDKMSRDQEGFAHCNDRAFRLGLECIIDGLVGRLS